jgi:hypothetical protein
MRPRRSIETLLGTPEAHLLKRREREVARRPMAEVIAAVRARCKDNAEIPADEPLFLLSAGWRSGSTLVQRLVNSGTACFLWGEPYSRADLVPRLADSLRPITDDWPRNADLLHENDGAVADRWTANLHPGAETLLDGHRALLPRAKFVFLVRDPLDAYASYRSWRSWYLRWPDDQVRTAWTYGGLWAELADGFLAEVATVGGIVIRYEDLVSGGAAISALEDLLGARVEEEVLAHRISGHDGGPDRLSGVERRVIARRTGPVARRLGYTGRDSSGDPRVAFAGDRQRPS